MKFYFLFFLLTFALTVTSCKRKINELDQTVVSIQEVKSIGELITAEYYGEVIEGLTKISYDSQGVVLQKQYEDIQNNIATIEDQLQKQYEEEFNKLNRRFDNRKTDLKDSLKFVKLQKRLKRRKKRRFFKAIRKSKIDHKETGFKTIRKIAEGNSKAAFDEILNEQWASFKQKHFAKYNELLTSIAEEETAKQDLIYIGRGCVRAGFDLAGIDQENIFLSGNKDTIFLLDLNPILFEVSINPYFHLPRFNDGKDTLGEVAIGQDTILGFQLIDAQKARKLSYNDIQKVKSACVKQLREEALERNILEHARINAEETLLGFFKLLPLVPGQEIKRVIISPSKYFYDRQHILYDGEIDESEFEYINEMAETDLSYLDSAFFKHRTLAYQQKQLDKFVKALYQKSKDHNNCKEWSIWVTGYFDKRHIVIEEPI